MLGVPLPRARSPAARVVWRARLRHAVIERVVTAHSTSVHERRREMVALIVLLLILAIFGGLGFAAHVLWFVLIAAVILWLLGFLMGGVESGMGRRRWYRW
jgi:hypothetical protein